LKSAAPVDLSDILAARRTIAGHVVRTPLLPSAYLSERTGAPFYFKMESMQPTGAFKLRGAINAASRCGSPVKTLSCCSTGNHGRSVAHAASRLGLKAEVYVSSLVPINKVDAIKALGAQVHVTGNSQDDAEAACRAGSANAGTMEISPFDNPHVVAGQGTAGLEILEDVPDLETLLVPLSGGGLAAGTALTAKSIRPGIRVIGLSMERGAAMKASIDAGRPVQVEEVISLADSLGGGIGLENRLTFDMCRRLLDDVVVVSEREIYRAMQAIYHEDGLVCEGASAVGVAAVLAGKLAHLKGKTATVITSRNVDRGQFLKVVSGESVRLGALTLEGAAYER